MTVEKGSTAYLLSPMDDTVNLIGPRDKEFLSSETNTAGLSRTKIAEGSCDRLLLLWGELFHSQG